MTNAPGTRDGGPKFGGLTPVRLGLPPQPTFSQGGRVRQMTWEQNRYPVTDSLSCASGGHAARADKWAGVEPSPPGRSRDDYTTWNTFPFVLRHSSLGILSSLVIRHSSFRPKWRPSFRPKWQRVAAIPPEVAASLRQSL